MSAAIVPFPSTARVAQIRKTAAFLATSTEAVAASHTRVQLEKLAKSLQRKGVPPDRVQREVESYRGALQAAVWRAVLTPQPRTPGGAA